MVAKSMHLLMKKAIKPEVPISIRHRNIIIYNARICPQSYCMEPPRTKVTKKFKTWAKNTVFPSCSVVSDTVCKVLGSVMSLGILLVVDGISESSIWRKVSMLKNNEVSTTSIAIESVPYEVDEIAFGFSNSIFISIFYSSLDVIPHMKLMISSDTSSFI